MYYRTQYIDSDLPGSLEKQHEKFSETHPKDRIRLVTVLLYPTTNNQAEHYRAVWEFA